MAKDSSKYNYSKGDSDDSTKTILLIGALLILIVVVGGALVYVITSKGAPYVPPASNQSANQTKPPLPPPGNGTLNTTTNTTNMTPACGDQCHLGNALRDKNFSECQLVSEAALTQDCYFQLSAVSIPACKALANDTEKKACIVPFALANNDSSLCGELAGVAKDDCVALFDPCLQAKDKNLCKAINAKDPERCGTDFLCIMNYSVAVKDANPCSKITDDVRSKACVSAVLRTDKCTDLSLQSQRDYCYELYAIYSDDYLTCTQIVGDNMYSLDCNSYFSARLRNLALCEQDSLSLNSLWACYTNYSLISGDPAGCAKIDPLATTNKFKCSFEFAEKFGDPSACQMITDSLVQRNTCYQGVILYNNRNLDWTKCPDVINTNYQDKCFIEAAKVYSNISLCDKIQEDYARSSCRESYAANKSG